MTQTLLKPVLVTMICLALAGCGGGSSATLRILAISTVSAIDIYTTIVIEEATPEERAEIRDLLKSIQPYTDQAKQIVDAKLALIDALDG